MSWLSSAMSWVGSFWRKPQRQVMFCGLDNSGKTTLLHILMHNRLQIMAPTYHPRLEEIEVENMRIRVYDLGGHMMARRLWTEYLNNIDGIVFIVDAVDTQRFAESKDELQRVLQELINRGKQVPVLVLGNKIDIPHAVSQAALSTALDVHSLYAHVRHSVMAFLLSYQHSHNNISSPLQTLPRDLALLIARALWDTRTEDVWIRAENVYSCRKDDARAIRLYMCSIVKRVGYADGLKWLAQMML